MALDNGLFTAILLMALTVAMPPPAQGAEALPDRVQTILERRGLGAEALKASSNTGKRDARRAVVSEEPLGRRFQMFKEGVRL